MIAVLVVDDSAVVRRLIVDALGGTRNIEVVGTAGNGRLAQAKIDQLQPDVVTMDIEMPEMNGIEAVRELRKRHPSLPVIMFSSNSAAGAAATLEALAAGATDYVLKPSQAGSIADSVAAVRVQLVPKIHALAGRRRAAGPPPRTLAGGLRRLTPTPAPTVRAPRPPVAPAPAPGTGSHGRIDLIAVGASTGGPDALTRVLMRLPGDLAVPIVVTQHMPPVFTRMFAERLDRSTPLHVLEADVGMELTPGTVYLAPGDRHLMLRRRGATVLIQLSDDPPENSCRPAVDVMFRSVAELYGASACAVVLTGMGHDGCAGAKVLRDAGAVVLAQDEASSVVWGMPGSVVAAGLADDVLSLDRIGAGLISRLGVGRAPAVAR
jgi:two-component system chemotaxis response regulator CheB